MAIQITPDLVALASDTIAVEPYLSTDEYGAITYGDPVDYRVRVIGRSKLVFGPDGIEHLSGATVVFFGEYDFAVHDRFTLPLRYSAEPRNAANLEARQPKCLAIDRESDENGAHHTTVYFAIARLRGF